MNAKFVLSTALWLGLLLGLPAAHAEDAPAQAAPPAPLAFADFSWIPGKRTLMNVLCRAQIGRFVFLMQILFLGLTSTASAVDSADVKLEGFIDSYYAYDFNGPPNFDRAYTTQPARSDEFNINLVYLGASVARKKFRGRVALQAGTSVQNNYAAEPTNGAVSGPSLSRSIQEAYIGYEISNHLWLDTGIYFSHVGAEGFISRDNLTYTRSLVADFSPYYQAGVRLTYKPSDELQFQLHVINGWQVISENNHSKTLGTQVSASFSPRLSASYSTLIGQEAEFRHFHDLVLKYEPSDQWTCLFQYDIGFQKQAGAPGFNRWNGFTVIGKYALSKTNALVARVEQYSDPQQVIVATGTPNGFDVRAVSLGYDASLAPELVWRSEARHFWSNDAIYPSRSAPSATDGVFVTSLSAGF